MNRLLKTSFNSGTSKQKSNVAAQSVFRGDSTVIILLSPPSALPNIPHMRRSNKLPNQQQQLAARQQLSPWGTRRINMQKFRNTDSLS